MTINAINSNIPIEVTQGGTGLATITQYSPLIGSGAAALTTLVAGTNGEVIIGATGAAPAFASLVSSDSSLAYTTGAGTLDINIANSLYNVYNGTYSPLLEFGGGSTGITYASYRCQYARLGNLIICALNFTLTSKGTDVGAATLKLPVTALAGNYAACLNNNGSISFAGRLGAYVAGDYMYLYDQVSGGASTALTDANFANNSILYGTVAYLV